MNSDLINLFAETFGIAEDRLLPEATLESLGLDSLAVIEFLFQIEDKFGIQIPDQANPPRTLDEMVQMIEPLMPQGGQGDMGTSAA
ncbi:MAG: acyl carrier protein [Pseudomonadota bacterium]